MVGPTEKCKKTKVYRGACEVAILIDQSADGMGEAPRHEPYTDEKGDARTEKCLLCDAEYIIGFAGLYGTKRTFEELRDQLQMRLREDHRADCQHGSLIPLRWSESARKKVQSLTLFWAAKCKKCGKQAAVRVPLSKLWKNELRNPSEKIKLQCPHCGAVNDFLGSDFQGVPAYIRHSPAKS